jgi:hypothetical protein
VLKGKALVCRARREKNRTIKQATVTDRREEISLARCPPQTRALAEEVTRKLAKSKSHLWKFAPIGRRIVSVQPTVMGHRYPHHIGDVPTY